MGLFDRLFGRKKEELEEKPQLEEQAEESYQTTETEVPFEAESQPLAASNEETAETQEVEFVLEEKIESTDSAISEQEFAPTTQQADLSEPVLEDEESPEQVLAEAEEQSETSANQALESSSESEAATESRDYYQELQERLAAAREQINYESEQEVSSEQEASTSSKVDSTEYGEEAEEELTPAETSESSTEYQEESVQDKYDRSLKKTRTGFGARLNAFFANFRSVDEDFFEDLEELLITSDVGVQVASNLTEDLRYEARLENAKKPEALRQLIIEKLVDIYEKDGRFNEKINFQNGLTVMLFVGVNGVGKTTSIGKLAYKYKQEGKKVMLVAADTFRAGAVAQLAEWGRRVDVPVVTGPEKSDPASVVFDGLERAKAENVDILMIDTAGRLQNKDNLMAELEKIGRIIKRVDPAAPHETFLALDASTGQNALVQAKEFSKITPVTGIVLTKIDGTARGGVVLAIRQELDIPVKLIGFGEKIDDIGEFNSENFMRGLLEGLV
ncbi:signal recognition particle-docking protein FtsY [Streptococcus cristatus]|jgi:signal recognition particle-docking protein ftsY|uniref:Signal recognition particle receptor FtsY n=2 Tax=Streptococcus cristatus TaxID=45634 RepID=A0A0F2CE48_STRCR|nr:signal recognition particle-docking protein FtsY [Streptococcus cristatus]QIP49019.1 signal recognition particle-docking protein FtsY [Streptococcus cristatus ATCC 51100]AGK71226.1 signal recognition particle-docking protein FtsY [Streptococcus cristatus AS 1.3089]KJQ56204.1 signal recognition particle-docking protein FtsY [Streptococcus cristatus]SQI46278.1 signal recognition particle-docking protein FtsY [Streptococcus cristatus]GEN97285.1 signal recognition particle receptor FtsY [Strept